MTPLRYSLLLMVAAVALLLLAGCGGSPSDRSPGLNPTVTFTFPEDTTLPNLLSGGVLHITGDATTGDSETNPITSYAWTQNPLNAGTFSSTNTLETTWRAPDYPGPGQLHVVLTLTVKTLLGGETVKPINILVTPPVIPPVQNPAVTWNFAAMNYTDSDGNPVVNMPRMRGGAVLRIRGTVATDNTTTNPVTGYEWVQEPDNAGVFSATNVLETTWSAPTVTEPTLVTLTVTVRTLLGGQSTNKLNVVVLPPGQTP